MPFRSSVQQKHPSDTASTVDFDNWPMEGGHMSSCFKSELAVSEGEEPFVEFNKKNHLYIASDWLDPHSGVFLRASDSGQSRSEIQV